MNGRAVGAILLVLIILAVGCKRRPAADLVIAGSTSVQPFAEKWAETYQAKHPGTVIQVQGGGSTAGVLAAETGTASIGMCSRNLHADEAAKLTSTLVALDGMTIIVHPTLPVTNLTLEQVQLIFTAELKSWKDFGGPKRIDVVTREEGSGARGAFEELVMKKRRIANSALVQDSQGAVRQMVSNDPTAIGYVSAGLVDGSVKGIRINGIAASAETVASGEYPLIRPFLFLTKGPPQGKARVFIDWILGPEGEALTRSQGIFPPPR